MAYIYYSTGEVAKKYEVANQTIRRWVKERKFDKVKYTLGGDLRIGLEIEDYTIYYARISSQKQKTSLVTQIKAIKEVCNDKNAEEITDIGSGFNFKRKGLKAILERCLKGQTIHVVVSNQDRPTRVGFEFLQWIFTRTGGSVTVLDKTETKQELDYDNLISFITVFCNSYYGKRNASRNKKNKNLSAGRE